MENGAYLSATEGTKLHEPVEKVQTDSQLSTFNFQFSFFLGLGTNLGDKDENLRTAVALLGERIGDVTSLSAFYVTEPWGFRSDNAFLNAACRVETTLSALEVLDATQAIERDMGRTLKSAGGATTPASSTSTCCSHFRPTDHPWYSPPPVWYCPIRCFTGATSCFVPWPR